MINSMIETKIKVLVKQIIEAGYDDPTNEDIAYTETNKDTGKSKRTKFRLYTAEKWDRYLSEQSDAKKLATKLGFGEKPDCVITVKDIVYYVRLIKE